MQLSFSLCFAIFLLSFANIFAQDAKVSAEPSFYGIEKTPVVVELPLPEYPALAKERGISGMVRVAVKVDEAGNVTVADSADGPGGVCPSVTDVAVLALRQAAIEAARMARFEPTILDNHPTSVSGFIAYDFPAASRGSVSGGVIMGTSDGPDQSNKVTAMRMATETTKEETPTGEPKPLPKMISGGVLNGKALSLPVPEYPAAARAVRASGSVSVQVLILEDGAIFSASSVSGHPLLRRASELAACSASFSPTFLQGHPVKVSGIITYNFNL